MNKERCERLYLNWIQRLVACKDDKKIINNYKKLIRQLYDTDFYYILPLDGNRYADGIELRYRFCYANGMDYGVVSSYLDGKPCSVLEMLAALSLRCEEDIMYDPQKGFDAGWLFWRMLHNLSLDEYSDNDYCSQNVDFILTQFMERDYRERSLFGLRRREDGDIWMQMQRYICRVKEVRTM